MSSTKPGWCRGPKTWDVSDGNLANVCGSAWAEMHLLHLCSSSSRSRYTVVPDGSDCRWQGWFFMWTNEGACVTTVQMHDPYLHHKWNSAATLSWSAHLPGLKTQRLHAGALTPELMWPLWHWVNRPIHANVKASEEAEDVCPGFHRMRWGC